MLQIVLIRNYHNQGSLQSKVTGKSGSRKVANTFGVPAMGMESQGKNQGPHESEDESLQECEIRR